MAKIITEKKFQFEITEGQSKERLDVYLTNIMENATRSKIQQLIKAKLVLVNGKIKKSNYQVLPNDILDLTIPVTPRPDTIEPEDIPLDIVYEDEYLLVVNKPAGMVVHPALGNWTGTMVHALLHHTQNLSESSNEDRPGIVHRIDKDTSGLLLVAKDPWILSELAKQFSDRTTEREYWAICWGKFKDQEGDIIGNLTRSKNDRKLYTVSDTEGKYAETHYSVIEEFEFASLIKLKLKTGRTHQIRVHLKHVNHPIFGDHVYNGRTIQYGSTLPKIKQRVEHLLATINRQALHAKTLGFIHPKTKDKLVFNSELPNDMKELIEKLKN
ncbi:MAG: RluA family pseudouridine synthase [Melioribacteraceae bacterium]|jgi:23S rRNA pseudouridine1911/1915/1917 synthase|nr:RluA family pseudouridine synthase [Melioribacteraceae bacterium]